MGMCILEQALKEASNKLAQANDYQVLDISHDGYIRKVPGYKITCKCCSR